MLKLKLQYFGHLMQRTDSLEKTLILRKIEGRRKRAWQRRRCLDSITDSMDMNLGKLWEIETESPGMLQFMGFQRVGHDLTTMPCTISHPYNLHAKQNLNCCLSSLSLSSLSWLIHLSFFIRLPPTASYFVSLWLDLPSAEPSSSWLLMSLQSSDSLSNLTSFRLPSLLLALIIHLYTTPALLNCV